MNLEQLKILEKLKISYLRHAGNIAEIVSETGYDEFYVRKMIDKFRKQDKRDVSVHIANNLMTHILQGAQLRSVRIMDMIKKVEGFEKVIQSVCCSAPIDYIQDSWQNYTKCMKCNKACNVVWALKPNAFNIYMKLIELLRVEDEALLNAAEKMGYTNKEAVPNVIVQQDNRTLILNDKEKVALSDYNKLPALDREKIIQSIENVLIEETQKRIENEE